MVFGAEGEFRLRAVKVQYAYDGIRLIIIVQLLLYYSVLTAIKTLMLKNKVKPL